MEVSDYLKLTENQKQKRKQKWEKKKQRIERGEDPDLIRVNDRTLKAIFILRKDFESEENILENTERKALKAIVMKRCQKDIYFFARYILDFTLLTEQTHKRWGDDLISAIKKGILRLMRLKPRGTYKTSLYGISFVLWLWGCIDPRIRIFYTSSNALLLNEVSDSLERFIGSSKGDSFYSYVFGIVKDENAKNTTEIFNVHGRTGKGFSLILRTAGGSTVGIHPNVIVVDDPLDQNDRESEAVRQQKVRWLDSLNPLLVPFYVEKFSFILESIFYIGTRWHMKDLCWHIFKMNERLPEDKKWDIEIESIYGKDGKTNYPEFMSNEKIEAIKASMSETFFSCNPGEAPILMNDFTLKRIDEVEIGDKLIGFTRSDGHQRKSKLIETEVLQVGSRISDIIKVALESGRVIRCTPDHKWYNGRSGRDSHSIYTPAKVGRNLLRVVDCHYEPSFEDLLNWRWLGGMFDGEGSFKQSQLSLHQSKSKNPEVYEKIISVLNELNLSYNIYRYKGKEGCYQFHIRGGRDVRAYLIRYGNCGKKQQIIDGIMKIRNRTVVSRSKHHNPQLTVTGGRDKIIKIEPDGREKVYSLQTTTGNYVVWGYASKNCQYVNNPLPEGTQIFDLKRFTFVREDQVELQKGQILCVFDPSKGKTANDYPAVWWIHHYNDLLTFFDAIDQKIELTLLIQQIAARNKIHGCRTMLFEDNNAFLLEDALEKAHKSINWHINLETVHHHSHSSKYERIVSIQPEMYSGHVRFMDDYETRYPEAMNQIVFYPVYGHDDFPDAAEMGIEYFRQPQFKFVRYEEVL